MKNTVDPFYQEMMTRIDDLFHLDPEPVPLTQAVKDKKEEIEGYYYRAMLAQAANDPDTYGWEMSKVVQYLNQCIAEKPLM